MKISLVSVLATSIIILSLFGFVFYYETVISYDENLFKVEMNEDHELISRYYGKSYSGLGATQPRTMEIDGVTKNLSFIYYTKTFADSPSRNLINNEKMNSNEQYVWKFDKSEDIDEI